MRGTQRWFTEKSMAILSQRVLSQGRSARRRVVQRILVVICRIVLGILDGCGGRHIHIVHFYIRLTFGWQ